LIKTEDEIEEIKSLMVNRGSNYINSRLRIKLKRTCKYGADVEVCPGIKLHGIESLKPIRGVDEINQNSKDQNELYHNGVVLVTIHLHLQFSLK
jgi:hypothetical protein